ncbi:MAG: crossover junction endodeoxyribonuclease RuvC [Dehalococcoidia bacterium]|jgi:crossover junction endodeoxyribonuclease RuvC|nr:crossover junction endodeoxyribonuclease RuvC [Dehalococcoidia bacterium]
MRVLGIDPGTLRMGYGLVEADPQPSAEDFGVVVLPKSMPLEHRLYQLYTHVLNLISVLQPAAIAVEDPFVGKGERRFVGPAIAVGQAQAVVLIGAAGQGVPVFHYSPAQVKLSVTDYGAASKEQMRQTIAATLGLAETPEPDAADALSVSLCHLIQAQATAALGREITPGSER